MRKYKFLLFCLLISPLAALGQNFEIKGKVRNELNQSIPYSSILLLQVSDSTTIMGTSADENGAFHLQNIPSNTYFIRASYIGNLSDLIAVDIKDDINIGSIIIKERINELDEVEVLYKRPTMERKSDRLVFNVANTNLSQESAYSIITKTPGVIIVGNQISIKNSPTLIYINNRRVYLSNEELKDLLENYAGENISSIEVITNPSAKYDAEGGAVLNILASKNLSIGYKGELNGKITQAIYPKYELSSSHYYKTETINLFANYGFNPKKTDKMDESYINFFNGNLRGVRRETTFGSTAKSNAHSLNTIMDFKLAGDQQLGLAANILYSPNKANNNLVQTKDFDQALVLESYSNTSSNLKNDNSNIALNVDYGMDLGNKGSNLKFIGNYLYFDDELYQDLNSDYYNGDQTLNDSNSFNSFSQQRNNIATGQIDFSSSLGHSQTDLGIKYSSIRSNSSIVFNGPDLPPSTTDDKFHYDEEIYAAYTNLAQDWDPWSLVLGLRGEYIDVKANSLTLGKLNVDSYFELFPSFSLQHSSGEEHIFGLSYKRAIERPRYQSLNPYRYFLNEQQYNTGNPMLGPAIENKLTLDYTLRGKYIFSLYYQHMDNAIEQLIFQDNTNKTLNTTEFNIEENFQYSADFIYFDYLKDWWYISTYMSGYYLENSFLAQQSGGILQKNNTLGYLGQVYNQFTLSEDSSFVSDLSLLYLSNYIVGSFGYKNQFTADLSFRKAFSKKRFYVTLAINDIFNTTNIPLKSSYLNQDNGFFSKPESRSISLGLRYKFGNYRLQDNHRDTAPAEQKRLEGKKSF
ncbi:TonB-dependent receptor [Arenibacter sp. N53]|uniref:outer membrane beta-barrel family protein n=1 Tax=Arenibacter TaxID=178469 RepID=UPI000CD4147D|nr:MULTISPECIES: outer membrane beta-barrel family protein [Arenibacter]MCM4150303.1 TonB-dependent receptor [Arenibacter sp. N53]